MTYHDEAATSAFARLLGVVGQQTLGRAQRAWGAQNPQAREAIRSSIAQTLVQLEAGDLHMLTDLKQHPRPMHWSVSVSHTQEFGGWMAVPRPLQVGWDAELRSRIKKAIVDRVCSADEIEAAPEFAYLWCAKEAFFKSLEDEQPLAIPQLTIVDWKAAGANLWHWRGLGPRNGQGLLVNSPPLIFAACIVA